jgi:hypothetical protein
MFVKTLVLAAAFAAVTLAAKCSPSEQPEFSSVVSIYDVYDCESESGFVLMPPSGLPNDAQITKMCKSTACKSLITAVKAVNPSVCDLHIPGGIFNWYKFTSSFDETCAILKCPTGMVNENWTIIEERGGSSCVVSSDFTNTPPSGLPNEKATKMCTSTLCTEIFSDIKTLTKSECPTTAYRGLNFNAHKLIEWYDATCASLLASAGPQVDTHVPTARRIRVLTASTTPVTTAPGTPATTAP